MIAVKPSNLENIIEVVINGKVTKEDVEELELKFKQKKQANGQLNVLLAIHEIEGYSVQALMQDLKFGANHWKELNKIAVFTDDKWIEISAKISNYLPGIDVKHFDFGEREQALEWLD